MDMLSVKEAAKKIGVCETVIRNWIKNKELAYYQLGSGRGWRIGIKPADLEKCVEARRVASKLEEPPPTKIPAAKETLKHLKLD